MRSTFPLVAFVIALALLTSCGAEGGDTAADAVTDAVVVDSDTAAPTTSAAATAVPAATAPPTPDAVPTDEPMPVEPDGGIGDGADPLPGADDPGAQPDWHGAEVAETNCPGVNFQRVDASAFSFSVPTGFADQGAQGIDSEVGVWAGDSIEVNYDFGWYSGSPSSIAGAEVTAIDYTGIIGEYVVVRDNGAWNDRNLVAVFFPEVSIEFDQPNRLSLVVLFDDPADEVVARCIVGSVDWAAG